MEKLIIKANTKSELELILKVNYNFDNNINTYKILKEEKISGLRGIFSKKFIYEIDIINKFEISEKKKEEIKVVKITEKEEYKIIEKPQFNENLLEEIKIKTKDFIFLINKNIKITKIYEKDNNIYIELKNINIDKKSSIHENSIFIGKKGKTLYSIESILNNFFKKYRKRIYIDIEKFKEKRKETIINLANNIANKVEKTKKRVSLNFMPASERKIIHEIISNYDNIESFSEGENYKRHIVIKYNRKKNV